ncbi:MAG TPA: alanine racemase [Anaeromyxobacteraceae bacterium]|nr:alanine racemase [Anaeromyxobacteraceae bacterium]
MPLPPSRWPGRPVWAEVDLDALDHNVRLLAARAAPACLYAVVKANAYGHGAVAVARSALAAGARGLAVVAVDEGEELRRAGLDAPIVVLGHTPASDAARAAALGLEPTVGSAEVLEALASAARATGREVRLHLELETGMNRHGLAPDACVALAERARATPGLRVEGLFTHFASADEEDPAFTRRQGAILRDVAARLPFVALRHCSASAGILAHRELALDMVRAGISLYGYRPAPICGPEADLRPVMALRARVARVADLRPGDAVGYGRTWAAPGPARVALLMCGYADGYRRGFGDRAHALLGGRRVPVVGRVSMDMITVDASAVPEVRVGDVATLLGGDGAARVDADELAGLAGTISYEILAGVAARVPRLYLRAGRAEAFTTLTERVPRPLPGEAP